MQSKPSHKGVVIINIHSSSNNTIITVTDTSGNSLFWASPSTLGFSGFKRSTLSAAEATGLFIGQKLIEQNLDSSILKFKGFGSGRVGALQGLRRSGINIISLQDVTPTPHNGCRPPKKRRL